MRVSPPIHRARLLCRTNAPQAPLLLIIIFCTHPTYVSYSRVFLVLVCEQIRVCMTTLKYHVLSPGTPRAQRTQQKSNRTGISQAIHTHQPLTSSSTHSSIHSSTYPPTLPPTHRSTHHSRGGVAQQYVRTAAGDETRKGVRLHGTVKHQRSGIKKT